MPKPKHSFSIEIPALVIDSRELIWWGKCKCKSQVEALGRHLQFSGHSKTKESMMGVWKPRAGFCWQPVINFKISSTESWHSGIPECTVWNLPWEIFFSCVAYYCNSKKSLSSSQKLSLESISWFTQIFKEESKKSWIYGHSYSVVKNADNYMPLSRGQESDQTQCFPNGLTLNAQR